MHKAINRDKAVNYAWSKILNHGTSLLFITSSNLLSNKSWKFSLKLRCFSQRRLATGIIWKTEKSQKIVSIISIDNSFMSSFECVFWTFMDAFGSFRKFQSCNVLQLGIKRFSEVCPVHRYTLAILSGKILHKCVESLSTVAHIVVNVALEWP